MGQDSYLQFQGDLDALERRIAQRLGDLKRAGRFTDAHASIEHAIQDRERRLRDRVAEAVRGGNSWDVMKAELRRDYSSLLDDLLRFEEGIDAEYAKNEAEWAKNEKKRMQPKR